MFHSVPTVRAVSLRTTATDSSLQDPSHGSFQMRSSCLRPTFSTNSSSVSLSGRQDRWPVSATGLRCLLFPLELHMTVHPDSRFHHQHRILNGRSLQNKMSESTANSSEDDFMEISTVIIHVPTISFMQNLYMLQQVGHHSLPISDPLTTRVSSSMSAAVSSTENSSGTSAETSHGERTV